MGDFNIDLLKFGSHCKTSEYLDNILSHCFIPIISKPTRVTNTSAMLIDHIYTSNSYTSTNSGIIITDVADHYGTFYSVSDRKHTSTTSQCKKTRLYTANNLLKFKKLLDATDFSHILQINCPNESFNEFIAKYKSAFDKAFPLKSVKINNKHIKREPCVTPGLLTSSRRATRTKLLTKKLRNPTDNNSHTFASYNNVYNKIKRATKANYYHAIIEDNKLNMKKTWTVLNEVIGRKNDKSNFPVNL